MHTEEEAKNKWCPHVRHSDKDGDPASNSFRANPIKRNEHWNRCIGFECMMARYLPDYEIKLSNNLIVIVDIEDAQFAHSLWWDGKYARNRFGRIHRLIAEACFAEIPDGYYVDHIDGNTLNNRRGNLRVVTPQQSGANQKSRGGKSKYRGVSEGRNGRWVAQLSSGGVRWCLGTFDKESDAAKAYDDKAKEIHGDFARLNLEPKTNSGRRFYCGLGGKP